MYIRKPRGGGITPTGLGIAILCGCFAGTYIWGPSIINYLETDPAVLASRHQAKLERELETIVEKSKRSS